MTLSRVASIQKDSCHWPLTECINRILIQIQWRNGHPINASTFPTAHGICTAVEEQNEIGWDNYMLKQWSKKWQAIQKNHLDFIGSKRSLKRWTPAIIRQFMLTCGDIWYFCNSLVHRKGGGRLARIQNGLIDTKEFDKNSQSGQKTFVLPIDNYLITTYSMRKILILDKTLLQKE